VRKSYAFLEPFVYIKTIKLTRPAQARDKRRRS
jgi:hypothetical protein